MRGAGSPAGPSVPAAEDPVEHHRPRIRPQGVGRPGQPLDLRILTAGAARTALQRRRRRGVVDDRPLSGERLGATQNVRLTPATSIVRLINGGCCGDRAPGRTILRELTAAMFGGVIFGDRAVTAVVAGALLGWGIR